MLSFVYLASQSPRRRELLAALGLRFEVRVPNVDESVRSGEAPRDYVTRIARLKAETIWAQPACPGQVTAPVLAADTTVTLDGRILGKPRDRDEARGWLLAMSGRAHEVLTAVVLRSEHGARLAVSASTVVMGDLPVEAVERYLEGPEAYDKAGAYAIQGWAGAYIREIHGSYTGIVGLPLFETRCLLEEAGDL